jgi:hypothetical protein
VKAQEPIWAKIEFNTKSLLHLAILTGAWTSGDKNLSADLSATYPLAPADTAAVWYPLVFSDRF